MIVSDYSNGDIIIYDITNMPATELGRIVTGKEGIMGIKIGPEGNIWYVNTLDNEVVMLEASPIGIEDRVLTNLKISPNPSNGQFTLSFANISSDELEISVMNTYGSVASNQ